MTTLITHPIQRNLPQLSMDSISLTQQPGSPMNKHLLLLHFRLPLHRSEHQASIPAPSAAQPPLTDPPARSSLTVTLHTPVNPAQFYPKNTHTVFGDQHDIRNRADCVQAIAKIDFRCGRNDEALERFKQVEELYIATGDPQGRANSVRSMGNIMAGCR
ncbi:hypothetical protein BT69DRAFT_1344708 [Atractiella rhizophila]|nr:hypothetical protein BT69DRAFT_1344708 [Atractiella rhizophila]